MASAQKEFTVLGRWKTCGKHVENMWKTCGKHVETVQMALQSERLETPWTALESLNRLHY